MFLHGFRFLINRFSFRLSTTQLLLLHFLFSTVSASQPASTASQFRFRFPVLPLPSCLVSRAFRPILSTLLFCLFPFVLPCFAPTAVPQVLPFWISPPGSVPDFHILSSASVLASHYSAICSSFSTFFPVSPHRWLFRCSCSALASQVLPLIPGLVSHAIFPAVCTRLSVSFLSSFLASLPQLFRKCLHGSDPLSVLFPLAFFPSFPLSFVRFFSGFRLLGLLFLPFPSSRIPLTVVLFGAVSVFQLLLIRFPFSLLPALRSNFGTWLSCNSLFRFSASPHRCYCSFRPPVSSSAAPLSFRLRFRYLGRVDTP